MLRRFGSRACIGQPCTFHTRRTMLFSAGRSPTDPQSPTLSASDNSAHRAAACEHPERFDFGPYRARRRSVPADCLSSASPRHLRGARALDPPHTGRIARLLPPRNNSERSSVNPRSMFRLIGHNVARTAALANPISLQNSSHYVANKSSTRRRRRLTAQCLCTLSPA